jgi:hypothetical protein
LLSFGAIQLLYFLVERLGEVVKAEHGFWQGFNHLLHAQSVPWQSLYALLDPLATKCCAA